VHEALLLQQVRGGAMRVGWTRTMSNKERVAAGSLFKAGLVEVPAIESRSPKTQGSALKPSPRDAGKRPEG
jgi:hypothetical protein